MVFIRLALAVIVLLPVAVAKGLPFPKGWRTWGHLTVAAVFANAFPYTLVALAEQTVDSNVVGALNATTPLWTVFLVYVVTSERPSQRRSLGLMLGFAGTLLIFSPWQATNEIAGVGGLQGLAAAASYGLSYVYMARYLAGRGIPPLMLAACQMTVAAYLMALALPLPGSEGLAPPLLEPDAVAGIVVLGTISTGFAYVLNYRLITDAGPTAASTVTYLLPVVAVLLGWATLDESVTYAVVGGLALVLTGVALAQGRLRAQAMTPVLQPQPEPALGLWLGILLFGATPVSRMAQAGRRALQEAAVRRRHQAALAAASGQRARHTVMDAASRRLLEPARRQPRHRQLGVIGATLLVGVLVAARWVRSRANPPST